MSSTSEAAAAGTFEQATAVTQVDDGRFRAQVDPGWSTPIAANGGYLAAILVRAIEAHGATTSDGAGGTISPRQLRSLTCHYLRPVRGGPLDVRVDVVRAGRRISTIELTASQDGKDAIRALAALAVLDLPAAGQWEPEPPPVGPPPPRDAPLIDPDDYRRSGADGWLGPTPTMPPMFRRVRVAPRIGGVPFSRAARGPASAGHMADSGTPTMPPGEAPETGGWIALPEARPIDAAFIALCTDVWWPPAFQPLGRPAIAPTIDLTIHVRADIPPAGLPDQPVLGWYRSTAAHGGLMEEDAALFLPDGTLLAHARQLAIFMPLER
ncbi:MAG TPA: thioesterase family protein [Conexibacter sp.]|nr:thioesterase family protein [Conexibacter sp.]